MTRRPLEGLRVLDLGTRVAAPFCAGLLGEQGAEVIKVEKPGQGDPLRDLGPFAEGPDGPYSLYWAVEGRGRKSVTLDLSHPEGQRVFRDLAARSDVLCENFRPGTLERWNIDPSRLDERLVTVRISVFGQDGPKSGRPGLDRNGVAYGGLLHLTGEEGRPPVRPGVTVTDNSILIDTSVAQFANGFDADSISTSPWRRFGLFGSRNPVLPILTPQNMRFYVGIPPTYVDYSGLTGTSNYRRDNDTFTINGTGLGVLTSVEIVNVNGNSLAANAAIGPTTGVTVTSGNQFSIIANSFPSGNLLDASASSSRRIKITTPFGSVVSDNNSSGAFTVSATPAFLGNTAATFAGGGFDGSVSTYDLSNGNLVINGNNFLGVKTIALEDNATNAYITTHLI